MVKQVANMSVSKNIYSNNIGMSNKRNINHDLLSGMTKEQLINMILNTTVSAKVGPVVKQTVSAKAGPVFKPKSLTQLTTPETP